MSVRLMNLYSRGYKGMKRLEKAIEMNGSRIRAETADGWREGKGVLYPLRYRQNEWGSVAHQREGRSDSQRYLLFCAPELLEKCDYGCEIDFGNERYLLIWKDICRCRFGNYIKACLLRITEEEGNG